jgi:hypothetical protein
MRGLYLAACDPLPEYDARTAANDLRPDLSAGQLTALSVCGFSCGAPGFASRVLNYCFSDNVSVHVIDPTGDMIRSDRHLELKEDAMEYAEAYNSLLLQHMQEFEVGECAIDEDWISAWSDLRLLVDPNDHFPNGVNAPFSLDRPFKIVVEDSAKRGTLPSRICQVFLSNGIEREIGVEIARNWVDQEPERSLSCAGRAARIL